MLPSADFCYRIDAAILRESSIDRVMDSEVVGRARDGFRRAVAPVCFATVMSGEYYHAQVIMEPENEAEACSADATSLFSRVSAQLHGKSSHALSAVEHVNQGSFGELLWVIDMHIFST